MAEIKQCPFCRVGNIYWIEVSVENYRLGCTHCNAIGTFRLTPLAPDAASRVDDDDQDIDAVQVKRGR